jgi:16S rRNA (cytosine967-C5)-methyltransferase
MKNIQVQLLESAAKVLKPDGIIIYSTCTIDPEENEQVVKTFIDNNPEFRLEDLSGCIPEQYLAGKYYVRTFPHKHKIDGSFAVRIRKIKN